MLALILALSSWRISDRVEAVVGDCPILRSEVLERLGETGADTASGGFEAALDELVEERILVEGARLAGFYPPVEEVASMVEQRLAEMREDYATEEEFLTAMYAAGYTEEKLEERLAAVLGDQRAVNDYLASATRQAMSSLPADPVAFLDANLELLEEELMPRRLSWILLPVLASGPGADSALAILEGLAARIASGEDFGDLARTYSQDPGSARYGGDLGSFGPGDMTPTFETALDRIEPGQVAGPFMTPYGAHLARLDSRDSSGAMTASHILIAVEPGPEDLAVTEALADSVRALVESGALSFAEAAALFSCDPATASAGGDLGLVLVRMMMPEAEASVGALAPGGLSDPVPIGDGSSVALFMLASGAGGLPDWSGYDRAWLDQLVRNVAYHRRVTVVVDSLARTIPVIRHGG